LKPGKELLEVWTKIGYTIAMYLLRIGFDGVAWFIVAQQRAPLAECCHYEK
jgi:hypothetical protein